MVEEWRDIYFKENGVIWDYRGLYRVSNLGKVKSLSRKKGFLIGKEKILNPTKDNKGYLYLTLRKNNQSKRMLVHRLVALVFIDNPNDYKIINHIDGKPLNNCVDNLEWCTQKHNVNHCFKVLGFKGSNYKKYRKNSNNHKPITQYDKNKNFIKEWDCIKDASEELGICYENLSMCLNKKRKTAGGYIWEFRLK